MPIKVVIAVSYTGRASSGVGFAKVAADSGMSISFRHGSRSWSARIGKENCCDMAACPSRVLMSSYVSLLAMHAKPVQTLLLHPPKYPRLVRFD